MIADSGQADHSSERSDAGVSAYRGLLASGTSSYLFLMVGVHDDEACGALWATWSKPRQLPQSGAGRAERTATACARRRRLDAVHLMAPMGARDVAPGNMKPVSPSPRAASASGTDYSSWGTPVASLGAAGAPEIGGRPYQSDGNPNCLAHVRASSSVKSESSGNSLGSPLRGPHPLPVRCSLGRNNGLPSVRL